MNLFPFTAQKICLKLQGRNVIDNMTFTLTKPHCIILLGANGAGKSLTLELMHGLRPPSSGTMTWGQHDPASIIHKQKMLFQKPVMLRRNVLHNLTFALALACRDNYKMRKEKALKALDKLGLTDLAQSYAPALSMGQQQIIALVRATLTEPAVLLLDEPTANLDIHSTQKIEHMIAQLKQKDIAIIMTTHDIAQARRLGDEILFLHRGRICEHAPATQFFTRCQNAQARAFLEGTLLP